MARLVVFVVSVAIGLVACGRGSSSNTTDAGSVGHASEQALRVGSCDRSQSAGTCSEYDATYLAQSELLLKSSCARLGGTFVYAECPNTSVVGGCTLSTGEIRKFYGTGSSAYEADRARTECTTSFRGSWQGR